MLHNFAKEPIIDVWRVPQCTFECNSIKSYKKVRAETIHCRNFHCVRQILSNQYKNKAIVFEPLLRNYF